MSTVSALTITPLMAAIMAGVGALLVGGCMGNADLGSVSIASDPRYTVTDATPPSVTPTIIPDGGDAAPSNAADASPASDALSIEFQIGGIAVSEARVVCPDTCVSVAVAARGGNPPYDYAWSDGVADLERSLCPASNGALSAVVHDARGASQLGTLRVSVDACPPRQLCAANTSFEGTPALGTEWLNPDFFNAENWNQCRGSNSDARLPRVANATSGDEFPPPTDGTSYLYLEATPTQHALAGQTLCAPLQVGSTYSFQIDLAGADENRAGVSLGPAQLEIYASSGPCQLDELLWMSPRLSSAWRTYCVTLKPTHMASALVLNPTSSTPVTAAVFVDHLVPVDACP